MRCSGDASGLHLSATHDRADNALVALTSDRERTRFGRSAAIVVALAAAGVTAGLAAGPVAASGDASVLSPRATPVRAGNFAIDNYALPSGATAVVRWNPCQSISYKINVSVLKKAKRASAVKDIKSAIAKLSRASGLTFTDGGSTSVIPTGGDWASRSPAELTIAYVDPSSRKKSSTLLGNEGGQRAAGTGGYTFKAWPRDSGGGWDAAIGRGFLVLDSRQDSTFRRGFGAGLTRGNLLQHELGHAVGLAHVDAKDQVMYPVIGGYMKNGYQSGDLAGLAAVGRPAGCITVPSWAWNQI